MAILSVIFQGCIELTYTAIDSSFFSVELTFSVSRERTKPCSGR